MANSKAVIDLVLDNAQFKRASASVIRVMGRMKDKMVAISSAAKKMLLISGGFLAIMVKNASDFEETASKFKTVFKDQADDVEEWADRQSQAFQRAKVDLLSFLATLQDTFVPFGFARDKAADLSKEVTTLAIDLASFNNLSDSEVIRDLTSALIGNHEAVRKYGVLITAVTLNQALMNSGFEKGTRSATEQDKVLARLNLITSMTGDAQGDAIKTAGSFANQLKGLRGTLLEVSTALGTIFIPVLKDVITTIKDVLTPISAWAKENSDMILTTVKWTGSLLIVLAVLPRVLTTIGAVVQVVTSLKVALIALKTHTGASLVAMGAWSLGIAAAVAAVSIVLAKISSLNSAMDESNRLSKEFARIWGEFKAAQSDIATATSDEEAVAALSKSIAARKALIAGFEVDMKKFDTEFSVTNFLMDTDNLEEERTIFLQLRRQRDAMLTSMREDQAALEALQGARRSTSDRQDDPEATRAMRKMTAAIKDRAAVYGFTATEAALTRISQMKLNFEQMQQLGILRALAEAEDKRIEKLDKQKSATEAAAAAITELTKEIAILQGGAEDGPLELIDLENLDNADGQLDKLKAKLKERDALISERELRGEAAALKNSARTSAERLSDELKRLEVLKQAGALDEAWFKRLKEAAEGRASGGGQSSIVGQFEGLQAAFRRIQTAAAAATDPNLKAAERTAESSERSAKAGEDSGKKLGGIIDLIKPLLEAVQDFGRNPVAGIFGP